MSVTGGPRLSTTFRNLYSYELDGSDDYLQTVSTFDTLDNEDTWVISCWVKYSSLVSEPLYSLTTGSGTFFTWVRSNGIIDTSYPSGSSFTRSTTALSVGDWNHVCIRLFPTGNRYTILQIWVNGIQGFASNYFGANDFGSSSSTLSIGWNTATTYAEMNMDELAVFIGDVNPLDIYNQNSGKPGNLSEFSTLPSNWWRMGEDSIWDGSKWVIPDKMATSISLNTFNMSESSRVSDTP
jgi:hypothetical protein